MNVIKIRKGYSVREFEVAVMNDEEEFFTHCSIDVSESDDTTDVPWDEYLEAMWYEYNKEGRYTELVASTLLDNNDEIIRLSWAYDITNGITEFKQENFKQFKCYQKDPHPRVFFLCIIFA